MKITDEKLDKFRSRFSKFYDHHFMIIIMVFFYIALALISALIGFIFAKIVP